MRKIIIPLFIFAFTFTGGPPSGWYQQLLPDVGGRNLQDIFFVDSLTGWAVTNATNQNPDTTYVLKSTNGGDNWIIQYAKVQTGGGFPGYFRVYFLDESTGYTCGVKGVDKTTDGGTSWISLNAPLNSYLDMSVLNEDTIWSISSNSLTGGVFRTTNGGINWTQQLNLGSQNPNHIYMINANTGFVAEDANYLRKTTNSGINWNVVSGTEGFFDIGFADSLTGWKAGNTMKKTTDGGDTWATQTLPSGGQILTSTMEGFYVLNKDTLWGVGGRIFYGGSQIYGMLYRTTNGGENWHYQVPDTLFQISTYYYIKFTDNYHGWAYSVNKGAHTVTGGDSNFVLSSEPISSEIPSEYKLYQNYPNPFNPTTHIKFTIQKPGFAVLKVYDISGREVSELINEKLNIGTYEARFDSNNLSSGVYFYSLLIDGKLIDTKKMMLVK